MTTDTTAATFGDEQLTIRIDADEAGATATLTDRRSGRQWGPTPLLSGEVHDKAVRRAVAFDARRVDRLEAGEDAAHVVLGDARRGVQVGVHLRVVDGELRVRLPIIEVYERLAAQYRLFHVDVMPELARVRGAAGRLVMPIGPGAECRPADKPAIEDSFLMYMEQPRWELTPVLPFCAAADDDGGLFLLATEGEADARCAVATDGEGGGRIGLGASLRRHWIDPVDPATRELRIRPLPGERDACHEAAALLRRYVTEELGKPTLRQRAEQEPEVDYLVRHMTHKLPFAIENEGVEMARHSKDDPVSYRRGMTFDQARDALQRLHDAGVSGLCVQCVGWNARGHDGLYPTRFPIDERLGGEDAFRRFIRDGRAMGLQVTVHDNFMMNVRASPDWDPRCVTHDLYGEPLMHGWWAGGIEYQSWPSALPRDRVEGYLQRMRDLGIAGVYHCDYMLQPLEVNYHPNHRGPRGEHLAGQLRILRAVKEAFGTVECELGLLPAAIVCDIVCSVGGRPMPDHWPVARLVDRRVPIFNLVFNGLTLRKREVRAWRDVIHALAYGEHPRAAWALHPQKPNQQRFDDRFIAKTIAIDEILGKRFGELRYETLERCEEIGEQQVRTTFANGAVVVADFHAGELEVNGEPIACPDALADPDASQSTSKPAAAGSR